MIVNKELTQRFLRKIRLPMLIALGIVVLDYVVGNVAGSLLNIKAYQALTHGLHKVNWLMVVSLFVIYGFFAYWILSNKSLTQWRWVRRIASWHPLIVFLVLSLGWSTVMMLIKLSVFYLFGYSIID